MVTLISLILATFRLCNLLIYEEGPYEILVKFRKSIGIIQIENTDGSTEPYLLNNDNQIGKLFTCMWCLSPYIALILYTISLLSLGNFIIYPLALSAGALAISKYIKG